MELSIKAVNQISRILLQAILPKTTTEYSSELFKNWKFGHQYFKAEAILDGGIRLFVERRLKMCITDVLIETESEILKFSIETDGPAFAFCFDGGINYNNQSKAPKKVEDVVEVFKSIFGPGVTIQANHYAGNTRIQYPHFTSMVTRFSWLPPVDVDVRYVIDGESRVPEKWRKCNSV